MELLKSSELARSATIPALLTLHALVLTPHFLVQGNVS